MDSVSSMPPPPFCCVVFFFVLGARVCMPKRFRYANSQGFQFYNYFPSKILKNIPVLVIGCIVLIDFYEVSH